MGIRVPYEAILECAESTKCTYSMKRTLSRKPCYKTYVVFTGKYSLWTLGLGKSGGSG